MRSIRRLSKETIKILKRIEANSQYHKVRQRAKCIQLSYQQYTIQELSDIFGVTYLTISRWLSRWDKEGLAGLYDKKGRGRKSSFTPQQKKQIKHWFEEDTQELEIVKRKIDTTWNIKISTSTIKRILKSMKLA